jgi:succinate dehydrogenase / fumarate reductase iron-sulfur subunit
MTTNGHRKTVTVRVQRYNPDVDKKPYLQSYQIEMRQGMTLLDALHEIKTRQDGSVTYRRSCRHAICGSCAMNVNGHNMLVCESPLKDHLDGRGRVTIRPLPFLPIIKDLVVDRTSFWEQYQRVKPWLLPPDDLPEHEFRVSPEEVKALHDAEKCIMCGVTGPTGVWRCHTIFNCIDACPKGLDPTYAIETLRSLAARRLAFEEARRARQAALAEPVRAE